MYCNFFGFSEKPFDVTPDPRFLYLSPAHREVLASLIYGIRERRGFITIVGEVGTGKTTVLNAVLDRLDDKIKVAFIFNTDVTFNEILSMALYEWGLITSQQSLSKVNAVQRLNNFAIGQLAEGGNVALIVDEAQNLDNSVMENLRLLSNLETRRHKLVQIVLSGQPELDTKLGQYELRQLAQRISLKRYIAPLSEKETYGYIQHRLVTANYKGSSLFNRGSKQLIWKYSGGVPRRINILCDNIFLIGYGLNRRRINESVVKEAIKDLNWSPFLGTIETRSGAQIEKQPAKVMKWISRPPFALVGSLIFAVCLILAVVLNLQSPHKPTQQLIGEKLSQTDKSEVKSPFEKPETTQLKSKPAKTQELNVAKVQNKVEQPVTIESWTKPDVTIEKRIEPKIEREAVEREPLKDSAVKITPAKEPFPQTEITKPTHQDIVKKPVQKIERETASRIEKSKTILPKAKSEAPQELNLTQVQKNKEPPTPKTMAPEKSAAITQSSGKVLPRIAEIQAPPRGIEPSGEVLTSTASTDKDRRVSQPQRINENALPKAIVPIEEKISSDFDQKIAVESPKMEEFQASIRANTGYGDLQNRLEEFLILYCQTYQNKQLDNFTTFFTSDAIENGKLFNSLIPKYRSNFNQLDSLDFSIKLLSYSIQEKTGHIHIKGVSQATARLKRGGNEWRFSSGDISMELVAHGNSFKIKLLDYKLRSN